jgi:NAD(P)-dependent dehydrogenase (short-subunit alcohol dehydrogenase family)
LVAATSCRPGIGEIGKRRDAAIERALAEKGADVAISYSASPDKAEAVVYDLMNKGVHAAAFKADKANKDEVERLVAAVVKRFGRLDILVNNAGVLTGGSVDDPSVDASQLERQFAVNVGGVAIAVRAAARVAALSPLGPCSERGSRFQASPIIPQRRPPWPLTQRAGLVILDRRASPSMQSSPARSILT